MSHDRTEDFLALEKQVWTALVEGDPSADARLLSDDFLGVYESGFADKAEHVSQLQKGPSVLGYQLSEAKLKVYSADVVLLSYLARFTRNTDPDRDSKMYVTSIWQRIDGRWKSNFSQDTNAVD